MKRSPLSKRARFRILQRDGFTCRYCGRKAPHVELQVDHIIPVVRGGSDAPANLVAACTDCNAGKSASDCRSDAELIDAILATQQRGVDYLVEWYDIPMNDGVSLLDCLADAIPSAAHPFLPTGRA